MTPKPITHNTLFYGDNLTILRERMMAESVDLVYLDPPFNSNRSYNVLFRDEGGHAADAQLTAFDDTWHWGPQAEETYAGLAAGAPDVSKMIAALRDFIGDNQMLAYLVMMAARLVELHRVLKPTGSLYLHCDPTASHYLKVVLDTIFGAQNFKSEIIWKRTTAHSNVYRAYGDVTDTILYYQKTAAATWNQIYTRPSEEEILTLFPNVDSNGRRWRSENMRNPGVRPNLHYPYTASNGVTYLPHPNGWTVSLERMQQMDREGRLHFPAKQDGRLRSKLYADEWPGVKLQNLWDDISPIGAQAAERMGYPTQKPLALLERIIAASSNPGDVVLDPFCGCGTAIAAAEKLGRRWLGIDVTHLAIAAIRRRMDTSFPGIHYDVVGAPKDLAAARALALESQHDGRYQFQWWALTLVEAWPVGGEAGGKGKKGSDKGIDGIITFFDDNTHKPKRAIVQVKSGHVGAPDITHLIGVINQEAAALGVFVTLEPPTGNMLTEAVKAGKYTSPGWGKAYPRIQILTIEQLLKGAKVDMPPAATPYKAAPKVEKSGAGQKEFWGPVDET